MVVILANGLSGVQPEGEEWESFSKMVKEACCTMAIAIAKDGEGASKFLEIRVTGSKSLVDARKIARSVCASSLVKAAMYGEDANWGRILAAAGYSGADFDPNKADIFLSELQVAANGQGLRFPENEALERLKKKDIIIEIKLHDGISEAKAWGCDLTHKYVDINANYRT
jgi:glutamate N-acetyltransferase/amino-acid N-acetyltransferase